MNSQYKHSRIEYLFTKNPFCHWCGVALIYNRPISRRLPDNFATLDHLHSRYDPLRRDVKFRQVTMVLACNKCNNKRAEIEAKELPIEVLWAKSGKYPRGVGLLSIALLTRLLAVW